MKGIRRYGRHHSKNRNSYAITWITGDSYEMKLPRVDGTGDYVEYVVAETPGYFGWTSILKDYPFEVLYLIPSFSQINVLEAPIEIIVR